MKIFSLDPVTGRVNMKPRENPLKDMTEEQQMFEAEKLINAIDRGIRFERRKRKDDHHFVSFSQGVLKPMVMDAEGKAVPAESVLQLREATLKNLHPHADDLRASESSDDEGDGGQVQTTKSK